VPSSSITYTYKYLTVIYDGKELIRSQKCIQYWVPSNIVFNKLSKNSYEETIIFDKPNEPKFIRIVENMAIIIGFQIHSSIKDSTFLWESDSCKKERMLNYILNSDNKEQSERFIGFGTTGSNFYENKI